MQAPFTDPQSGKTIVLLVARDAESRGFIHKLLAEGGHRVFDAVNEFHAEVLYRLIPSKIDLIITDASPSQISAWEGEFARTAAVIAITDSEDVESGYNATDRPIMFLQRPLTANELLTRVQAALSFQRTKPIILIVDDDQPLRRMLASLLEAAGYEVAEASGGKEALDRAELQKPDVVLTELVMPEMEGLQLIEQLKQRYARLKIVAMSGAFRAETYLKIARSMGADATLLKPLIGDDLLQTLQRVTATS